MDVRDVFFEASHLSIVEQFLRATFLYVLLFVANKTIGFKQPGILTPYNFLMTAGISHIAATRMVVPESRPIDALAIIVVYTLTMLIYSYGYLKFPSIVTQKPIIIVKNGKIIKKNLKKSRLTADNLFSILREKGAFNLEHVDYLVAEATGDYSVNVNSQEQPVTKSVMTLPTTLTELSHLLIYEGKIDQKVMKSNNVNLLWINQELEKQNILDVKQVFIGILTPQNTLYINKQEDC